MHSQKFEKSSFLGSSFLCCGLVGTMAVSACSGTDGLAPSSNEELTSLCRELQDDAAFAASKDAISALTDPELVAANDAQAGYLLPTDRVIGLNIAGQYIAVPHNVLWFHEIANFDLFELAVTYCPLTGSTMVFQRSAVDGAEFGVSGLLLKNNLVMYDRAAVAREETLWPQMVAGGRCGPGEGRQLGMFPVIEIEWADWVALHPDTRVVGADTGRGQIYTRDRYPYGNYEVEDNAFTLQPLDFLDPRRPPKERVLGIPFENGGGIAFPFGTLRGAGDLVAIHGTLDDGTEALGSGDPFVVFWDAAASAAMAFRPLAGQDLTFEVRDGAFVDLQTESRWSVDGEALSGPSAGQRLAMIPEAYVSFWFAFATFFPNPVLWGA